MRPVDTSHVILLEDQPFDMDEHTLIFTHIPKCGGTSLHETFTGIFGKERYRIFRGAPGEREGIPKLRGAGGHQRFGANPLHRRKSPLVYTTVIREPFAQFMSYYHHIVRDPHHHLRRDDPAVATLSPMEMIEHHLAIGNRSVCNIQTSMLAPGAVTPSEAVRHVTEHYSVVGVLEDIGNYLQRLESMFPNHPIASNRLNADPTKFRWPRRGIRRLRERVYELNQLDLALYEGFRAGCSLDPKP